MDDLVDSTHERPELILDPPESLVLDHGTGKSRKKVPISSEVNEKRIRDRGCSLDVLSLVGVRESLLRASWDDLDGDLLPKRALFDHRESFVVEDSFDVVVSARRTRGGVRTRRTQARRRWTKKESQTHKVHFKLFHKGSSTALRSVRVSCCPSMAW